MTTLEMYAAIDDELTARSGTKQLMQPDWAGNIVAMTQYNGHVIVACERGVFRLINDEFVPIRFVQEDPQ